MVCDPSGVSIASTDKKPTVLAVMLEFDVWEMACKWSYASAYALVDGLKASGCEVLILPSVYLLDDQTINPWLQARHQIIGDRTFDQVWVWTTHSFYDQAMWHWIRSIAPIRVGVLMESLTYVPSDIAETPRLAARKEHVYEQLQHLTHVISGDESDLEAIAGDLGLPTYPYFPMLPRHFAINAMVPLHDYAVFLGTVYGKRRVFFESLQAGDVLRPVSPPEQGSELPAKFDYINADCLGRLRNGAGSSALAAVYVDMIAKVRLDVVRRTLAMYNMCLAGVSLPAIYQGVTGRIVEMMAASTAILLPNSEVPVRSRALLRDGENVLCYDGGNPRDLERQARRLKNEPELREHLVANSRSTFEEKLSSEVQIGAILAWLAGAFKMSSP